jgi:hypothetical protein
MAVKLDAPPILPAADGEVAPTDILGPIRDIMTGAIEPTGSLPLAGVAA